MGKKHASQYANFGWLRNKIALSSFIGVHPECFIPKM